MAETRGEKSGASAVEVAWMKRSVIEGGSGCGREGTMGVEEEWMCGEASRRRVPGMVHARSHAADEGRRETAK